MDPHKYRKEKPPISTNGKRTVVAAKMTVVSLSSFEELEMTFKAQVQIVLTWHDNRLEFVNLKKNKKRGNMIGLQESDQVRQQL